VNDKKATLTVYDEIMTTDLSSYTRQDLAFLAEIEQRCDEAKSQHIDSRVWLKYTEMTKLRMLANVPPTSMKKPKDRRWKINTVRTYIVAARDQIEQVIVARIADKLAGPTLIGADFADLEQRLMQGYGASPHRLSQYTTPVR